MFDLEKSELRHDVSNYKKARCSELTISDLINIFISRSLLLLADSKRNFEKYSTEKLYDFETEYDYESIMHYRENGKLFYPIKIEYFFFLSDQITSKAKQITRTQELTH